MPRNLSWVLEARLSLITLQKSVMSVLSLTAMRCIKKLQFWKLGGFDERFVVGQDGDLNYRIGKKGNKFLYIPEAQVLPP